MDWQTHLEPGERLLWHGAPVSDLRLTPARNDVMAGLWGLLSVVLLTLFAWVLGAFSIIWPVSVLVALPLGAMLLLSLYHLVLKHQLLGTRMRAARYALSNRRALIFAPALLPGAPARLFALELRADTRADLTADVPHTLTLWHWPEGANKETPAEEIRFPFLADGQTPLRKTRQILRELP